MMKIYELDEGTIILINIGVDISSALNCKLYVKRGDDTEAIWTPRIYNNIYLKYTTVAGDVTAGSAGKYKITPYLEIGDWHGSGETVNFDVHAKYE